MSGISIPMHDPDAERWVNGEISNEEWKAHVLAKYRRVDEQVQAARAQAAPEKRRRWFRRSR